LADLSLAQLERREPESAASGGSGKGSRESTVTNAIVILTIHHMDFIYVFQKIIIFILIFYYMIDDN